MQEGLGLHVNAICGGLRLFEMLASLEVWIVGGVMPLSDLLRQFAQAPAC